MGKSAKIEKLKKKIKKLKKARAGTVKPGAVSPLAPPEGFPDLPEIAGVRFASAAAGVKYQGRDDVMLAVVPEGSSVAGVFTRSATRAAPVLDCEAKLAAMTGQEAGGFAFVVNSGNANAFTGGRGQAAVDAVAAAAAEVLNIPATQILTSSTGVIGEPLPSDRIAAVMGGLKAALAPGGAKAAARAIMTTDTFPKGAATQLELSGKPVKIAGFAKGSGMIAPDMATMLVYIFTDAAIDREVLQGMLSDQNGGTFNAITVDGDTSTSDTLLMAATGAAGNDRIDSRQGADATAFEAALGEVMRSLAHLVVRDGEGATKFVEVAVTGAQSDEDARLVAMAIANSPLVKTAIAGEDPNWGRIVMAIGKSGAHADRDRISISFGDILVAEKGWVSESYREELGAAYMKQQELCLSVALGLGQGAATVWTCDLTHQYITINADYRS